MDFQTCSLVGYPHGPFRRLCTGWDSGTFGPTELGRGPLASTFDFVFCEFAPALARLFLSKTSRDRQHCTVGEIRHRLVSVVVGLLGFLMPHFLPVDFLLCFSRFLAPLLKDHPDVRARIDLAGQP